MGTLSLGFSEKLIMRFGPRTTLIPGVCMVVVAPAALRPHPGRRQLPDRPAAAVPADRRRRRHLLPGDHDPGDVGRDAARTPASPPAWSTPACRWAARSAWRCWRRSRPSAPTSLLDDGVSNASALNSGYHLAYLIGAGLAAIAVAIAVFVLRDADARGAAHGAEAPEPTEPRPAPASPPTPRPADRQRSSIVKDSARRADQGSTCRPPRRIARW